MLRYSTDHFDSWLLDITGKSVARDELNERSSDMTLGHGYENEVQRATDQ